MKQVKFLNVEKTPKKTITLSSLLLQKQQLNQQILLNKLINHLINLLIIYITNQK
jgi:hypothetical protein